MTTATASSLSVDRRSFVRALEQVARVLPAGRSKPILQGIRLQAADGMLWLAATDLETSVLMHLPASDDLLPCVVPGRELLQRVKAGKCVTCNLELQDEQLLINGGAVRHQLATMPVQEYPLVRTRPEGACIEVPGDRLRQALEVALVAVARESSRYAINGVLFEVKADAYVVATDGRRMVSVNLCDGSGDEISTILPVRFCRMLLKLIPKDSEDAVHLYVEANGGPEEEVPADVYATGSGWLLHSLEVAGRFPAWRDVVPQGGSRFLLDRAEFLGVLDEVTLASDSFRPGVHLRLADGFTRVSACSAEGGESSGQVKTRFLSGGDSLVLTGFNGGFLRDALKSLSSQHVEIRVHQNTGHSQGVSHRPAVLSGYGERPPQWVLMPVNTGIEPGRESLGSNWREEAA